MYSWVFTILLFPCIMGTHVTEPWLQLWRETQYMAGEVAKLEFEAVLILTTVLFAF